MVSESIIESKKLQIFINGRKCQKLKLKQCSVGLRLGVKYKALYLSPSTSTLQLDKYKSKSKYRILTEYLSPSTSTFHQVQVQVLSVHESTNYTDLN